MPKEYDSWAQAPVPAAESAAFGGGEGTYYRRRWHAPRAAEVKRRITAGGGVLLTLRFAFSARGGQRPGSMTRGPWPPCQRLGHPSARRAISLVACRGVSGGILL
jgi:hypothetical protein